MLNTHLRAMVTSGVGGKRVESVGGGRDFDHTCNVCCLSWVVEVGVIHPFSVSGIFRNNFLKEQDSCRTACSVSCNWVFQMIPVYKLADACTALGRITRNPYQAQASRSDPEGQGADAEGRHTFLVPFVFGTTCVIIYELENNQSYIWIFLLLDSFPS